MEVLKSSSFGDHLLTFEELDSTNKTAAELLSLSKADHGTVILANSQRDGRGQRGASWTSSAGQDITLSLILKPKALRADAQFALSKMTALAVSDTVRAYVNEEVRIKWPNDILIDRKKISGILIKNEIVGELVMASIIGVGLNVNNTHLDPDHVATSLALETGKKFDRMQVTRHLLDRFQHWWDKWNGAREEGLVSYSDRLWTRGRWVDMTLDGEPIKARTMDVDEHGKLIIEREDGSVVAYGLDRLRFAKR